LSTEHEDQAFQYVALYEHRIGISVRPIGDHVFIISNGFLTSHAYNLALTWLWRYRAPGPERAGLGAALRHNYKKFFAECVLAHENRLIGRALLIETLVYEQDLMQPMFDVVAADPGLGQIASEIAQLMSSLAAQHELTHYFKRRGETELIAHCDGLFDGSLGGVLETVRAEQGEALAEEVLCDAFAAHQATVSDDHVLAKHELATRARMTAFGFMVFADLMSLEASARATAAHGRQEDQTIDLSSEKHPKITFGYSVGRRQEMDLRAAKIVDLLGAHLGKHGQALFADEGIFPLPATTGDGLRLAFERFGEEIEPIGGGLTGTDLRRRGLAQLLADHGRAAPISSPSAPIGAKRFSRMPCARPCGKRSERFV
jgi:hypothetical protein